MKDCRFVKNNKGEIIQIKDIRYVLLDLSPTTCKMGIAPSVNVRAIDFHYDNFEKMWDALQRLRAFIDDAALRDMMRLKTATGGYVSVDSIIAVSTTDPNRICLHAIRRIPEWITKENHDDHLVFENESDCGCVRDAIQTLLTNEQKPKIKFWAKDSRKWICFRGNMFAKEHIRYVWVDGLDVVVNMECDEITIKNKNDEELKKCLRSFDFAIRDNSKVINLDGAIA